MTLNRTPAGFVGHLLVLLLSCVVGASLAGAQEPAGNDPEGGALAEEIRLDTV